MDERASRAGGGGESCSEAGCGRGTVTSCAVCGRALCGRHGYKTWWWAASGAHYGMVCEGCLGGEPVTGRDERAGE
jgi:hypothetical protein